MKNPYISINASCSKNVKQKQKLCNNNGHMKTNEEQVRSISQPASSCSKSTKNGNTRTMLNLLKFNRTTSIRSF